MVRECLHLFSHEVRCRLMIWRYNSVKCVFVIRYLTNKLGLPSTSSECERVKV